MAPIVLATPLSPEIAREGRRGEVGTTQKELHVAKIAELFRLKPPHAGSFGVEGAAEQKSLVHS